MNKKYSLNLLVLTLLCVGTPSSTFAIDALPSSDLFDCKPAASVDNSEFYPGKSNVNKSSNLRRISGSGFFAKGTHITLSGIILDEICQAIPNALVEIWHADADGTVAEGSDKHFAGSGKIYTNNLGAYQFTTIMPASIKEDQAPYVSFKISHPKYKKLSTVMFFPEHPANQDDRLFTNITRDSDLASPAATRVTDKNFNFNISVRGTAKFLDF